MQAAIAAMIGASATVAACWSAGELMLGRAKLPRAERAPVAFVLGAATVHLAVFAILAIHVGHRGVWWGLLGTLIVAGVLKIKFHAGTTPGTSDTPRDWTLWAVFGPIFAIYGVVYLANAWAPETSPDGSGYHLGLVAEYVRAHGFERVATNMYASLGEGVEMLYVPAFAIGRHSAAALIHFAFLIALALAMFAYGRRIGKTWAGAAGAALVFVSPVVGRDGTTAYIDVATAAIVFTVFYLLEIWDEQRDPRWLMWIGLLAGYAYAAKYTAFVIAPYALGFVAWRSRKLRPAAVVAGMAAVAIAPWMLKDWIYVHNPVAPFFNQVFPNPYVHISQEQNWTAWLRRYDIANLWTLPRELMLDGGKTEGLLGPIFLLAPLALLALRERAGRRLLAPGLILLAAYFGNIGTRFLIPCLPFFALAMALAVARWRAALGAMAIAAAAISWPWVLPRYANRYLWHIEHFPYRAALRIGGAEQAYMWTAFGDSWAQVQMIEQKTRPGERVFGFGGVPAAYTSRDVVSSFEGASNNTLMDFLNVARWTELQPLRWLEFRFPPAAARQIRLVETAQGQALQQWNVHELRFFHNGVEIARSPAWRIRAWPNPWEIQLAFDNSPATRWRSWQTASPGMYIQVDFGREETVDEVRMETSRDDAWPIRFEVRAGDTVLANTFEEKPGEIRGSIHRAAAYEVLSRGFQYVLVHDQDWRARDFTDDPESWGMQIVGRTAGATLLRILP